MLKRIKELILENLKLRQTIKSDNVSAHAVRLLANKIISYNATI